VEAAVQGVGRRSIRAWIPPLAWAATVALVVGMVFFTVANPGPDNPSSPNALFVPLFALMIVSTASMGALLTLRVPRNVTGWLLLAAAPLMAAGLTVAAYLMLGTATGRGTEGLEWLAWLINPCFQGGLIAAGLVILVFPEGRLSSHGRISLAIILVGLVASQLATFVDPNAFGSGSRNPTAVAALAPAVPALQVIGNALLVAGFAFGALLVAQRLRRAHGDERKQLAWFAYVAVYLAVCLAVATLQLSPVSDVAWWLAFLGFAALPVAIAIAITKYRLYEIDRLINRTLVYVPLIGILGGLFAAATALLQKVFVQLTGVQSDGAVILSTLVVVGVFTPLRKSLETAADKAFRPVAPTASSAPGTSAQGMVDISALLDDPRFIAAVQQIAHGEPRTAVAPGAGDAPVTRVAPSTPVAPSTDEASDSSA
jgi:hypothetical protein